MANQKKSKYGLLWDVVTTNIDIEISCIQNGGQWKDSKGRTIGEGLFHHYKELQKLLWPEDDHHRWSDLILTEVLQNTISVCQGPKDSGKTNCALVKFGLTDYFCFPNDTLILISSTDVRGLELRIWGEMKTYFSRAKARYPWLPGHLIDSKHAISTQNIKEDDVRDLRRGIIGIPCLSSGGSWIGIGKYIGIKQKRRRLLGDECFPEGTLIDTPSGPTAIEQLKAGDAVISAVGHDRIIATMSRSTSSLVQITATDGRKLICTPNHPVFTQKGWIKAGQLNQEHYMIGANETMHLMQGTVPAHWKRQSLPQVSNGKTPSHMRRVRSRVSIGSQLFSAEVLQQVLRREVAAKTALVSEKILHRRKRKKDFRSWSEALEGQARITRAAIAENAASKPDGTRVCSHKGIGNFEGHEMEATDSLRQRHWANSRRESVNQAFSGQLLELSGKDWDEGRQRFPHLLQSGHRVSEAKVGNRSRRGFAQYASPSGSRREEDDISDGAWVDCVTPIKQEDIGRVGGSSSGVKVYNLQVEGHPSYSVNGFLVHNCQAMRPPFLDAIANLNSGNFKGVFCGNPIGEGDPLDKLAEPKGGWGTEGDITKTTVWDNRFLNGRTINLVGTDSPNFDFPQDEPPRYPYLIHKDSIDRVVSFYGTDSIQYYAQCLGIRKAGINARRVITRQLCKKFGAMHPVVWLNSRRTKIYGCDAAYRGVGGDRCVVGWVEFGQDVTGKVVMRVNPPKIVPVSPGIDQEPEDQIVEFIRTDCEENDIPSTNIFYDATGRGSLGGAFARLYTAGANPIEFGGSPTERPVSLDLYIYDEELKQRRLKRCDEEYVKFVTELWFAWRWIIESGQMRELPEEVMEEGCLREWGMSKGNKVEIEPKSDTKERMGRSPDLADWLVTCIEGARRKGFQISKLAPKDSPTGDDNWKRLLRERSQKLKEAHQLNYAA